MRYSKHVPEPQVDSEHEPLWGNSVGILPNEIVQTLVHLSELTGKYAGKRLNTKEYVARVQRCDLHPLERQK